MGFFALLPPPPYSVESKPFNIMLRTEEILQRFQTPTKKPEKNVRNIAKTNVLIKFLFIYLFIYYLPVYRRRGIVEG